MLENLWNKGGIVFAKLRQIPNEILQRNSILTKKFFLWIRFAAIYFNFVRKKTFSIFQIMRVIVGRGSVGAMAVNFSVTSVTRLGSLAANFLTKVAQIFCKFLGYFEKHKFQVKTVVAIFLENLDYFLFQLLVALIRLRQIVMIREHCFRLRLAI